MYGRRHFVWHARLKPIGVPLAASVGVWRWNRERSVARALGVAGAVLALSYLASEAEFVVRRREWWTAELRAGRSGTGGRRSPRRPVAQRLDRAQ